MPFVDQVDDSELFERDHAALGYVPNYTRLFAQRPAVYEARLRLKDTINVHDGHAPLRARNPSGRQAPRLELLHARPRQGARRLVHDADAGLRRLGAEADSHFAGPDPELRDVLTVGRPIAADGA